MPNTTLVPVTSLIELIDEAVKSNNPKGLLAAAEWLALTAMVGHMDHVLRHLDPAALEQAVQDATACRGGETPTGIH